GAPAEVATPSGGEHTAPATAAPAGSNGAPGEEHREGEAPPAVTSGDPLAQRERQDS
ncbi:MAG: acetyl-CoA carboxylase, biotin carboxyl carrier protein, partial [Solirubrobacterales bacterium]|nr:acetyl-CoA carboxylase, biotin carboxyl carrier protein [Solirubrobacterales bacterium]